MVQLPRGGRWRWFARSEAVGKLAGDGHHDERAHAARREGQTRLHRRIAEQRLEEYGQQQAAIEHEAMPHNTEVNVKPVTQASSMLRRPMRLASRPHMGRMTALETR